MAAPKSPKGAKSDKEWRDAIRLAVHDVRTVGGKKVKNLRALAEKLVARAIDGDVAALKEIGDRLDGKPAQSLHHSGEVDMGIAGLLQAIDGGTRGLPKGD